MGGRLILEGVLKIYWGLKVPVTLASHNLSYWRRRSQKEQNGYVRVLVAKSKDGIVSIMSMKLLEPKACLAALVLQI